jgi:hypothetical protein
VLHSLDTALGLVRISTNVYGLSYSNVMTFAVLTVNAVNVVLACVP